MDITKAVNDFIDKSSRGTLIAVLLSPIMLIILVFLLLQVRPLAHARLASMLDDAGFDHVTIGDISLHPSRLHATGIKLDAYGLDTIAELDVSLNWPSFLTSGKISQLDVKGVSISRDSKHFASAGRQLANNLLRLPSYRVSVSDVTLDLDTGFGAIRTTIDAVSAPQDEDTHAIRATIRADQYQLSFNSTWEGTLKKGGALDLAGTVLDGRMNAGPLRVSRFNGWVGASIGADGYALQSQLEAGSATFMNVPLQSVTLVSDSRNAQDDVIVRAGISGLPDILFTADLNRTGSDQSFNAVLQGKNLGGLLDYADEYTKSDKKIDEPLARLRKFSLVGTFQPEKRFAGGPMPFGVTLVADGKDMIDGNVLLYPETFDVRGSLETDDAITTALKNYFKIPSANIAENFIRLNGDARAFLGLDATPEQQAEKNP